jgi:hypothetical protein
MVKERSRAVVMERPRYMAVVLLFLPRWTCSDKTGWYDVITLKTNTNYHRKDI